MYRKKQKKQHKKQKGLKNVLKRDTIGAIKCSYAQHKQDYVVKEEGGMLRILMKTTNFKKAF